MASRDLFIEELAQTVNKLFEEGISDPRAQEIAEAHFDPKVVPGDVTEAVRKRLAKIRDKLRADYQHNRVHLVSTSYYPQYREKLPQSEESARLCLPLGYRKAAEGIRIPQEPDDPIWQATVMKNIGSGAGKTGKNIRRLAEAFRDGDLSPDKLERALQEMRIRSGVAADDAAQMLDEAVSRVLPPASDNNDTGEHGTGDEVVQRAESPDLFESS